MGSRYQESSPVGPGVLLLNYDSYSKFESMRVQPLNKGVVTMDPAPSFKFFGLGDFKFYQVSLKFENEKNILRNMGREYAAKITVKKDGENEEHNNFIVHSIGIKSGSELKNATLQFFPMFTSNDRCTDSNITVLNHGEVYYTTVVLAEMHQRVGEKFYQGYPTYKFKFNCLKFKTVSGKTSDE